MAYIIERPFLGDLEHVPETINNLLYDATVTSFGMSRNI